MRAATRYPVLIAGWFLIVLSAFHVPSVLATEQKAQKAVTFSIPDVWPWAYEDDDGELHGSLIEVINRLSDKTGIPITSQLRPLRRAIVELRTGEVNFSMLFENPEMDIEAVNVAQIIRVNILLAAMAESDYPLTLGELKGKKIAYIRGTYLGEAFETDTDVVKVPVSAIRQAVELLARGRISAILASDHNLYRTLSSLHMSRDALRYSKHVPGQRGTLYMSRAASRPEAARKFSAAIAQMEANGELQRIFYGKAASAGQHDTAPSSQ